MKRIIITVLLFFIGIVGYAQSNKEVWESYLANFEDNKPGSVTVRMDLIKSAPILTYPYVVVTGVTYQTDREDGFPTDFNSLYKVEDYILETVQNNRSCISVGTATYDKERLQYLYVKDTVSLRSKLEDAYKVIAPDSKYYLNIKKDEKWEYYLDFLYPNDFILNEMMDRKLVTQLKEAGDDLSKERDVHHWIYFKSEKEMFRCLEELEELGYKLEKKSKISEGEYQLVIWHNSKVDLESINKITWELIALAYKMNGYYDGWETQLIN